MEMSSIMRDQPQKPLDRAIFWIEYVIRHKGATHLRTASRRLNFLQKDHVDVHFLIFSTILLILGVFGTLFFKLCKKGMNVSKKRKND